MKSWWMRWWDSDIGYSFRASPTAIVAALIALVCALAALLAPWVAPHNPFDLASLELGNARLPPAWYDEGRWAFPLGTDDQGRDILSALIYGARISLFVGLASVVLSVLLGVTLGLLAGLLACVSAEVAMALIAARLFDLPMTLHPWLWFALPAAGAALVGASGWLTTRHIVRVPPMQSIRALG